MNLTELTKIPKVLGAGLVTNDGFLIESQCTVGYNAEKFGAMAAKIIDQIKKSLSIKEGSVILYASKIIFLAKSKPEGALFVIGHKDANLGLIKIKFEKI